jgi:hypothetical protein
MCSPSGLALEHRIVGFMIASRRNSGLSAKAFEDLDFGVQHIVEFATELQLFGVELGPIRRHLCAHGRIVILCQGSSCLARESRDMGKLRLWMLRLLLHPTYLCR